MKFLILLTLLSSSVISLAQPEGEYFPDFTETDIDGVEHSLYADYLDNGKIVVIDIFATWCPNCVNSLPGLDDLEDEYGDDLVFLAFERDESTSNEASWAEMWGASHPIFANSINTMSTWNTEYQPNYFVICSDGTFELKIGAIGSSASPLDDYVDVCISSGANSIQEKEEKLEFSILTNPVNNEISFETSIASGKYRILNLTGKLVDKGDFETKTTVLDASSLETGLYFLRVESRTGYSIKKFIKN